MLTQPSAAHEVEISGNVGGTMHIEPNDSPKAGTASLAWFALTQRGGRAISLADCTCSLAVYAHPYHSGDSPLQTLTLTAANVDGRQGVPSTTITFPSAGAYELVLSGQPKSAGAFAGFQLQFDVTVAQ